MDTCTTCGLELLPQARFCRKCGTPSHLLTPSNELHSMLTIPTDVSAAETFISNRRTPFPPTTPLPTIGPNVQGELGHIQSHPNEAEQEYRNRQIGLIGLGLVAGAEAVPLPHLPTIQGVPQPSTIPTLQGTPSMPGNAAPAHFPATGANHFAPGHTAQPGYIPGHAAHTGHVAQAGHAGQAVAAKAAGGLATKWIVIIIITTAVVVTASGGGALAYVLTRPQPVISISSTYTIGSIPVGSYGTILHISGQKFSNHSAITILLDGQIAPSAPNVVSDQHGSISADIPITAAWPLGQHILTARDADNYASKIGIQVEVVPQGQAHTPGPNGAPPDNASFIIRTSVDGGNGTDTQTLLVTGHADPSGGSVCMDTDNGQPQTSSGILSNVGLPYTATYTYSCSGTYKGGKISYTKTLLSAVITVDDNGTSQVCHLLTPGTVEQLSGSYSTTGSFSGTVTFSPFPTSDFSCTTGGQLSSFQVFLNGGSGTWTGTYTLS